MNRRGVALIFGLLVALVLSILTGSLFFKAINENNLVKRHTYSTKALWLAEAGVAQALRNFHTSPNNDPGGTFISNTTFRANINGDDYYDISATGIVDFAGGQQIRRSVNVVAKQGPIDPSKFPYAISAANELEFGPQDNKDPEDFLEPDIPSPETACNGHSCWEENNTAINFHDLFGYEIGEVEQIADNHYTEANFPGAVSGITWVDVSSGSTLMATSALEGSGILIINGNVHLGGDYQFRGILYVLGTLDARGTFDSYGSVIVSSTAGVDSINGTPTFHWDQQEIEAALDLLSNAFPSVVSWNEAD